MISYAAKDPFDAELAELIMIAAKQRGGIAGDLALDLAWLAREWCSGQDGLELLDTLKSNPNVARECA